MLMNLTIKNKKIVDKNGLQMRKLYKPYLPREAAARGLLEVSLCRKLRKLQLILALVLLMKAAELREVHNRYY